MRRTTTARHILSFPFTLVNVDVLIITYAQNGDIILEKELDSVIVDDKKVTVVLDQDETARFDEGIVEVQAKMLLDGHILATQILRIPSKRILHDELIEVE